MAYSVKCAAFLIKKERVSIDKFSIGTTFISVNNIPLLMPEDSSPFCDENIKITPIHTTSNRALVNFLIGNILPSFLHFKTIFARPPSIIY